jgi:hypothetical protein
MDGMGWHCLQTLLATGRKKERLDKAGVEVYLRVALSRGLLLDALLSPPTLSGLMVDGWLVDDTLKLFFADKETLAPMRMEITKHDNTLKLKLANMVAWHLFDTYDRNLTTSCYIQFSLAPLCVP